MSNFQLRKQDIEEKYHIDFDDYFFRELQALKNLEADGLVHLSSTHIKVTEVGRLLVRNIAVIFDTYITQKEQKFSRAI